MNKFLEWAGAVAGVVGSFLVAMHKFQIGYNLFLVSCILCLTWAIRTKKHSLVVLNLAFLAANLLGLYNAYF